MVPYSISVGARTFPGQIEADVCGQCGEEYYNIRTLITFDAGVACQIIDEGISDGPTLTFLRKQTSLTEAQFARLLGTRTATVTRWEQGAPIDPAAWNTLCNLVRDAMNGRTTTRDQLRAEADQLSAHSSLMKPAIPHGKRVTENSTPQRIRYRLRLTAHPYRAVMARVK